MSDRDSRSRCDIYRAVTDSIVAAIDAGAGAFVMPWHSAGAAIIRPENAQTHMAYHGVNVLALWAQAHLRGFQSGYRASYKQWQHVGAQVRHGEHGTTIVFYKQLTADKDAETDEERQPPRLIARASRVFNAAQVTGWHPPMPPKLSDPVATLAAADAFIRGTGARIAHGGTAAFYNVSDDDIRLPDRDRFTGTATSTATEAYYGTVLHELVHWTGAAHRLDRKLIRLGGAERAAEELVAEIGAAFLCADLGVSNLPRPDYAAYVAHWLELLRGDARAVFVAARLAGTAATYLHDVHTPR